MFNSFLSRQKIWKNNCKEQIKMPAWLSTKSKKTREFLHGKQENEYFAKPYQ